MSTPIYDEFSPCNEAFPVTRAKNVWFDSGNGNVEDAIVYGVADQLIKYPYSQNSGSTSQGATYTFTSDADITINRTSPTDSRSQFFPYIGENTINLIEGHKYTLSLEILSGTGSAGLYMANRVSGSPSTVVLGRISPISAGMKASVTFEYKKNAGYQDDIISLFVESDVKCTNLKVRIMLESGGAAHEFSPYNLSRIALRNDIEELKAR